MVNVEHARAMLHFLPFWWGLSAHSDKDSEAVGKAGSHCCTDPPTVHGELGAFRLEHPLVRVYDHTGATPD